MAIAMATASQDQVSQLGMADCWRSTSWSESTTKTAVAGTR